MRKYVFINTKVWRFENFKTFPHTNRKSFWPIFYDITPVEMMTDEIIMVMINDESESGANHDFPFCLF